jgi:predicted Rossmann fold flavoprotein
VIEPDKQPRKGYKEEQGVDNQSTGCPGVDDQSTSCDLILIGAGPSGLFCALNSYQKDKRVLVLEKKESPGRKLLISGSGRCNLTHDGDIKAFLDQYGSQDGVQGRFLRPALLGFDNKDLISFFEARGLSTVQAEGGKVFPRSLRSRDVLKVLVDECRVCGVEVRYGQEVRSVLASEEGFCLIAQDGVYQSPLLVIATGGCSYPATGSTGDGHRFARDLGHNITELGAALTPVYIKGHPFSDLSGISFPNMEIYLYRNNKKINEIQGDLLFTHQGLSGPGILDLSRYIRPDDVLKLSFVKGMKREELEGWLQSKADKDGARGMKSFLGELCLPPRLIKRILEISKIPLDIKGAQMTREMRFILAENLTGFPAVVECLGGYDIAMVTRGGVDLREVNHKTLESRLIKGLYLVGEVLDVDGNTGGYNLQAAFSTGVLAARSIRKSWGYD